MNIQDRLVNDMKEAMKEREKGKLRLNVIRMVRAALKNAEIERGKPLDEQDTVGIIMRELKQRRESLADYERAGREDAVETLRQEIDILQQYLPDLMSESEIEALAREVIREVGATGPADLGKVMGPIMAKTKGRAEGAEVNRIVRRLLAE